MKLVVREDGSAEAVALWLAAAGVVSARVLYVEARSTLAAAGRGRRVTATRLEWLRGRLEDLVEIIDFVELHPALARVAGDVAERFRLGAHDAVHLASALSLGDRELVVATWDDDLRRAASEAGLALAPAS